jgi:hypothetical protein
LIVPSQGFPLGPAALPGEARTLATLGHVPVIVHVHQAGELIVDVGSNPILVECLGHWATVPRGH